MNTFIKFNYAVLCMLLFSSCSDFMPLQDCGHVLNINVEGLVIDIDDQPIDNAEIQIRSKNQNLCPNAPEFETVVISSQADGTFNHIIDGMSEGEIIIFIVSADGKGDFSTVGTYTLFDEEIKVQLFPQN